MLTLAQYEYGPFGEPIRTTGTMANNNPFLFSTKYYDSESGLYYCGHRFYNPSTGTWPNRDPISEVGFQLNTGRGKWFYSEEEKDHYIFVGNDPLDNYDVNGLNPAACAIAIALSPVEIPAGAVILGTVAIGGTIYITYEICQKICRRTPYCKPCSPLAGTGMYRVDYPLT
jgi:RHS repeat-associated protein